MKWRDHANCIGMDITIFLDEQPQAYTICDTCMVQPQCLQYALQYDADDLPGIYGGHNTETRRTMAIPKPKPITPFTHGTIYGYRVRQCRCQECKTAHADTRRRQRQNAPRRTLDTQPAECAAQTEAQ